MNKTTIGQVQPNFGEGLLMNMQTQVVVAQVTRPRLIADPNRLAFTVKIHNQLNRVFHGQGSVVQFNVDNKFIPFNDTDYAQFTGGIVPPLNDEDFPIYGPPLDMLHDHGTITIRVYDVVTATDAAGNTTEKQNYTWDFTYKMKTVTDTGTVQTTRSIMDNSAYQQLLMRQQMQQMQQMQRQAQHSSMQ